MTVKTAVSIVSVYPGPFGGAIFAGRSADGETLRFVANSREMSRPPIVGESWAVAAHLVVDPKYGRQFKVTKATLTRPTGRLILNLLVKHPAFRGAGIGTAKANRLWEEFGPDLYEILGASDRQKLSALLTERSAEALVDAWQSVAAEGEVVSFLDEAGFDVRLAEKIRRIWRGDATSKLRENPYRMLAFSCWENVDRAARSLGLTRTDPRRQVAAVEASLYARLDAKHTVTRRSILVRKVAEKLGTNDEAIIQSAINRAVEESAVVLNDAGYQPLGAYVMETAVQERVRQMTSGELAFQGSLFAAELQVVISDVIRQCESESGIRITGLQRRAIEMTSKAPFSVITGGAGTGKTTVLRAVHGVSERLCVPVIQMALSGRAAQRMRAATGREALTIAAFLRLAEQGKIDAHGSPLIIVDEASMLDLPLTYSILKAIPRQSRLVLVGDSYQLAPIGFGLVFHVIAASASVPKIELVEIHRHAGPSGIASVAADIRNGRVPDLPKCPAESSGVSFIDALPSEIMEKLMDVLELWDAYEDVQILGTTKNGQNGVRSINALLHDRTTGGMSGMEGYCEGEPIIHLVNDYAKGLWNGSLGRVERVSPADGSEPTLPCSFEGRHHHIPFSDLDRISLAYAITVHKAQGSQFERVIIPIVRSRLLDRTLVYTALTRAVQQVVFIGDRNLFRSAVASPPQATDRDVGLLI